VFEGLGDARAAALEALRIAEELGSAFSRAVAFSQMGTVHLVAGEWEAAERFYADALDIQHTRRVRLEHECMDLAYLARAQSGNGKLAAARATAEEAVGLARERGQRLWELVAQITLAEVLAAERGSKAQLAAEVALTRAAELIRETSGRAYEPRLVEARARLARACGDAGAADRHLRDAHGPYGEFGAAGHGRRLARELAGGTHDGNP
jgi:hypothetical protein